MSLRSRLEGHLEQSVASQLTPTVWSGLSALEQLLVAWSKAVGLVGFKTVEERDRRYFGESLAALEHLPSAGVAFDIGSGGGAPALPLSLARPGVEWWLVESNGRKCAFLEEAVSVLGLRAKVVQSRYEDWPRPGLASVVTLRGVAMNDKLRRRIAGDLEGSGRLLWLSSASRLERARVDLGLPGGSVVRLRPGSGSLLRVDREGL